MYLRIFVKDASVVKDNLLAFLTFYFRHSVFAELFCEAIKNGLPALQTQHPGIYFHKAAEYIQKRKEAFMQCNGKYN